MAFLGVLRLDQDRQEIVAAARQEALSIAATDAILLQRRFDALGTIAKLVAKQIAPAMAEPEAMEERSGNIPTFVPTGFAETNLRLLGLELTELTYELEIPALLVLDANGKLAAYGARYGSTLPIIEPALGRELLRKLSTYGLAEAVAFDPDTEESRFYIARVISQGTTMLGGVIVVTTSQRILRMLQHGSAEVIVTDDNGVIVASQDRHLLLRSIGPPLPTPLTSSRPPERYGGNQHERLPASFMSEEVEDVVGSGTVHAQQSMTRSPYNVHVVTPVRELKPVQMANIVTTVGLVLFGLLLIFIVGFAIYHLGRIRYRASRDTLTGLSNRHHANNLLPRLTALHDRGRIPGLAVVVFDLDRFKRINDTWGHATGDLVLQRFAKILGHAARSSDLIFRFGGEEFVAVLVEPGIAGARVFAHRVLEATEAIDDMAPVPPHGITVSAGVTSRRDGEHLKAAIARADELLYAAKTSGRNCVMAQDG